MSGKRSLLKGVMGNAITPSILRRFDHRFQHPFRLWDAFPSARERRGVAFGQGAGNGRKFLQLRFSQ